MSSKMCTFSHMLGDFVQILCVLQLSQFKQVASLQIRNLTIP